MTDVIERTLEIDSPLADVWRALTDPTELSGWFGDHAELSSTVGSEGWFAWDRHGRFAVRVEAFEPQRRFAWRWSHQEGVPIDASQATTLVEWTLTPRDDGGTTLHLRESGFETVKHFEENSDGWREELEHLVAYLRAA